MRNKGKVKTTKKAPNVCVCYITWAKVELPDKA